MKIFPLYKENKLVDYFDSLADVEAWIAEYGTGMYHLRTYNTLDKLFFNRKPNSIIKGKHIAILRCK